MSVAEKRTYSDYRERLDGAFRYLHIDQKKDDLALYDEKAAKPDFWDNAASAQELSKQASLMRDIVGDYEHAESLYDDLMCAHELAAEDEAFYREELGIRKKLDKELDKLEIASWFSGRFDNSNAIVSVNPGSGGLEAQDWTEMLYRMYTRYADHKGWKIIPLDVERAPEIGIHHAVFQVEGRYAYGMLRSEMGVHRLVRISPTDEKKRRHTTFAAVEVLPVLPDDIEVNLQDSDVRVDVYRSSGPGGQCVNTTDSAVRLTHIPTGIVVTCQNEKSQLLNKESAFKVLRARLFEREEKKRAEELSKLTGEKSDNSFGSQIRNYVLYPYQLIKDVRSGYETGNVDAVLDGEIEDFILAYHQWRTAQQSE